MTTGPHTVGDKVLEAEPASRRVDFRAHWQAIHEENGPSDVSWYQATPTTSLKLIDELKLGPEQRILDVGCGQAGLSGALLDRGFRRVTALDISSEALRRARESLGKRGQAVEWVEADVLDYSVAEPFDVWHDRAVLHFFTDIGDQRRYVASLDRNLAGGGVAIIAGFAPDGPEKCSRLPVVRRDSTSVLDLLGPGFELIGGSHEIHTVPWGKTQAFQWTAARKR